MTTELISRTGRVQSWLDNPESRLPVSCTVFVVEDTMEGPDGIEASWRFVSHALRYGAGVAVHLSKIRIPNVVIGSCGQLSTKFIKELLNTKFCFCNAKYTVIISSFLTSSLLSLSFISLSLRSCSVVNFVIGGGGPKFRFFSFEVIIISS